MVPALLILTVAALVPAAVILRARVTTSDVPRINLIPDMDYQPKYLPQTANAMFLDGRAARPHPQGTIARGRLVEDAHFSTGRVNDDWAADFPMPLTADLMARGRQRFEIYCSPCHGLAGAGDGLVARRADRLMEQGQATWTPPANLHDQTVRERPVGHLFNTITYGIRTMPSYGSQVTEADRWAIVAYVRALQRSSAATLADVPADVRPTLQ
jgi:mono/diheme cytochrome c family protein